MLLAAYLENKSWLQKLYLACVLHTDEKCKQTWWVRNTIQRDKHHCFRNITFRYIWASRICGEEWNSRSETATFSCQEQAEGYGLWDIRTARLWLCTIGNLIASVGAYFPSSVDCKLQWVLIPSILWKILPPSRKIHSSQLWKSCWRLR